MALSMKNKPLYAALILSMLSCPFIIQGQVPADYMGNSIQTLYLWIFGLFIFCIALFYHLLAQQRKIKNEIKYIAKRSADISIRPQIKTETNIKKEIENEFKNFTPHLMELIEGQIRNINNKVEREFEKKSDLKKISLSTDFQKNKPTGGGIPAGFQADNNHFADLLSKGHSIRYSEMPQHGRFFGRKLRPKKNDASAFEIYLLDCDPEKALFKLIEDKVVLKRALRYPKEYILSTFEATGKGDIEEANELVQVYGVAEKEGNDWKIAQKGKMEYQVNPDKNSREEDETVLLKLKETLKKEDLEAVMNKLGEQAAMNQALATKLAELQKVKEKEAAVIEKNSAMLHKMAMHLEMQRDEFKTELNSQKEENKKLIEKITYLSEAQNAAISKNELEKILSEFKSSQEAQLKEIKARTTLSFAKTGQPTKVNEQIEKELQSRMDEYEANLNRHVNELFAKLEKQIGSVPSEDRLVSIIGDQVRDIEDTNLGLLKNFERRIEEKLAKLQMQNAQDHPNSSLNIADKLEQRISAKLNKHESFWDKAEKYAEGDYPLEGNEPANQQSYAQGEFSGGIFYSPAPQQGTFYSRKLRESFTQKETMYRITISPTDPNKGEYTLVEDSDTIRYALKIPSDYILPAWELEGNEKINEASKIGIIELGEIIKNGINWKITKKGILKYY